MAQNNEFLSAENNLDASTVALLRARLNQLSDEELFTQSRKLKIHAVDKDELIANVDATISQLVRAISIEEPMFAATASKSKRLGKWSAASIARICLEAQHKGLTPFLDSPIRQWFTDSLTTSLSGHQLSTLFDLKNHIELRGKNWHLPIAKLGAGKAGAIEAWFAAEKQLGAVTYPDAQEQLYDMVTVTPGVTSLVPMDRLNISDVALTGEFGLNRQHGENVLGTNNDVDAIKAFLYRHRNKEKTLESYSKEIERFFLWSIIQNSTSISSICVKDCEAYKDFLAKIPPSWIGPNAIRQSSRWRPFRGQLSPKSQDYAISILNLLFNWLTTAGYLKSNPWLLVERPSMTDTSLIDEQKHVPKELWKKLTKPSGYLDQLCEQATTVRKACQYRLGRAVILLLSHSGLRRQEASTAIRNKLKYSTTSDVWELEILGKGDKWRRVILSKRAVDALAEHWKDRGHNFDDENSEMHLLSPVEVASKASMISKHYDLSLPDAPLTGAGYSVSGLYLVLKRTLNAISKSNKVDVPLEQRQMLKSLSTHAFRHSFASVAANSGMELNMLKNLLGHSSIETTSGYIHSEKTEMHKSFRKVFS